MATLTAVNSMSRHTAATTDWTFAILLSAPALSQNMKQADDLSVDAD